VSRDAVAEVIATHQASGREFEAAGVRSFVLEEGSGTPAVMVHGVPTSSFLYRKLLGPLATAGLRPTAFDLPGLGLAERPEAFDYSWSGLAAWTGAAIDALGIDHCHLVVHDIGGPIGFEWAIRNPDRVLSVTVLNTMLNVATFNRPWPMHPFSIRIVGELWLRGTPSFVFARLFYQQGIADRSAISRAEVEAYRALLRRGDDGRAFLRIMRGFELSPGKQRFLWDGLARRQWPARVVWGERDPALGLRHLAITRAVLATDDVIRLPAKHFLQEDQAPAIATAIAELAGAARG
jgi:haloalkane dehalogenase